jgi:hypothetical protein
MDFSFGIITDGNSDLNLLIIINSIYQQNIENFEIIIIGNSKIKKNDKINIINFDESLRSSWITKKKNIISENAKYENIVFLHDYVIFDENWYKGFLKFGNNWNICMNVIKNKDGNRFRDWSLWYEDAINLFDKIKETRELLLPYDVFNLSHIMYISGTYWVVKKEIMKEFPLNENLIWGESEDVEWSKRVRQKYNFSMNDKSTVHLLKQKYMDFNQCKNDTLKKIKI